MIEPAGDRRTGLSSGRLSMRVLAAALLVSIASTASRAEEPPTFVRNFGRTGTEPGSMHRPAGVAIDGAGNYYVAELYGDRVQKFDASGMHVTMWGRTGTAPGAMREPSDVVIDHLQRVWVADRANHRLQWFTLDGALLGAFGDTTHAELYFPNGLGLDPVGPYLFVADTGNNRIRKFDISGERPQPVLTFGEPGSDAGRFINPLDVAVSRAGEIHTTEYIGRVQIFSRDGVFRISFGRVGPGPGQFSVPAGVAVDSLGRIYITDTFNGRVQKFERNGRFILSWGPSASKAARLNNPIRMLLAADGLAVVCDHDPSGSHDHIAVFRFAVTTAVARRSLTDVRALYRGR
jgi:DNA-binding beta-propeller fold protein YncE